MIRNDFVSNSSSSSFIIDAESDPQNIFKHKITFQKYTKKFLEQDIFGRWLIDDLKRPEKFKLRDNQWFIDNFLKGDIYWHLLETDTNLMNQLYTKNNEFLEITNDRKAGFEKTLQYYNELNKISNTLLKNIADVLEPVYGNIKLHYICAYDDCHTNGTLACDEDYYRNEFRKLKDKAKFSREYNEH